MEDARKQAREKAIERQRQKQSDPAWRAAQYEKKKQSAQRQQARQREKLASPEYRAQQREKAKASQIRLQEKQAAKPKKNTRGLKGRTPTAEEKRIMDAMGKLPCIACWVHGKIQPEVSLHHIDGRTVPDAHKKQLPLCCWHHQLAAPPEIRAIYPWLVPVHAAGKIGGKAEFERLNGTQEGLLQLTLSKIQ